MIGKSKGLSNCLLVMGSLFFLSKDLHYEGPLTGCQDNVEDRTAPVIRDVPAATRLGLSTIHPMHHKWSNNVYNCAGRGEKDVA